MAVTLPRAVRALVAASGLAVLAAAAPVALAQAGSSSNRDDRAARLMRLDPGARLGGNTQVATRARARLFGAPQRVNFMLGLGPRQRIVGGDRDDQLGARGAARRVFGAAGNDLLHGGKRDRLLVGGPGNDLIYGAAGDDRLRGGPDNDRLVDRRGSTTVRPGSGSNEVDIADGEGDDRVLCAAGASDRIEADRGDRIAPACRTDATRSAHRRPAAGPPPARAAQARVTGDGSNANPYTSEECANATPPLCIVASFPARTLPRLWSNEYVPAYQCPPQHPYLVNENFAPFGTAVVKGVEVAGLGPVGVSITLARTTGPGLAAGTFTGFGASSATSWSTSPASYRVILHCHSEPSQGWRPSPGVSN